MKINHKLVGVVIGALGGAALPIRDPTSVAVSLVAGGLVGLALATLLRLRSRNRSPVELSGHAFTQEHFQVPAQPWQVGQSDWYKYD